MVDTSSIKRENLTQDNGLSESQGGHKVLVVDDSGIMRKMIITALSEFEDFNFIQAINGIDALEKMKEHDIKLIILDYNMPKMNGIEFMKNLKENKKIKEIPIVMLTTEADEKKVVEGYVSGARVYMTKPFKPEELVKTVKALRYWHMN